MLDTTVGFKEKKPIYSALENQFGVLQKFDSALWMNAKKRVYLVNNDIAEFPIGQIRVDSFGLYIGEFLDPAFRPSVEGSQFISHLATKNILDLTEEQVRLYFQGDAFQIDQSLRGLFLLRSGDDIIGCAAAKDGMLINFHPKTRRIQHFHD